MSVQIVHDEDDAFGRGIAFIDQVLDELSPLPTSTFFGDPHKSFSAKRLNRHENFGYAIANVLIVYLEHASRFGGQWFSDFSDQLLTGFIHAHDREPWVVRALVNVQHVLHAAYKFGVVAFWDFPVFREVRSK